MKTLHQTVDQFLEKIVLADVKTVISNKADRHCNLIPIAKSLGLDWKELGKKFIAGLKGYAISGTMVGPYLNIHLSDQLIVEHLNDSLMGDGKKDILIDFGSPNIAKALHVGHLRSLVIGESLRRILLARGHNVMSDIHYGDWGLPMGMLILELLEDPHSELSLESIYPIVVQKCKDDPKRADKARGIVVKLQANDVDLMQIWRSMREKSLNDIMPEIYRLQPHFDYLFGESDAQNSITTILKQIPYKESDGALIVRVAQSDDRKAMPPLMFRNRDGGYTYAATDLATILNRQNFDTIIYVTDDRQTLHFQQVFRVAKSVFPHQDFIHVKFGTVNGPDGKPFKTRDGNVPTLRWMVDAAVAKASERTADQMDADLIGIGAIKYADLSTNRESGYKFDLDRIMSMEGKTGPYIQYAAVRMQSIFRKVGILPSLYLNMIVISHPAERELLLACANLPEMIALAEKLLMPSFIAEHAFTVAQKFSKFYTECPVIDVPEMDSRLMICIIAHKTLCKCLELLGIGVPVKM